MMNKIKSQHILTLILIVVFTINHSAQSLEVDGGAKITTLPTDNTADKIVVQQVGGTLAIREANSLGGGLAGIHKILNSTAPETVANNAFPSGVAVATCPVGEFVLGGTCTDSYSGGSNALNEWTQGGSGTVAQQANAAFGRTYACRSRNSSGMTLTDLVITATAICAIIP